MKNIIIGVGLTGLAFVILIGGVMIGQSSSNSGLKETQTTPSPIPSPLNKEDVQQMILYIDSQIDGYWASHSSHWPKSLDDVLTMLKVEEHDPKSAQIYQDEWNRLHAHYILSPNGHTYTLTYVDENGQTVTYQDSLNVDMADDTNQSIKQAAQKTNPAPPRSSGVTMSQFSSIHEGMSYAQVSALLGSAGEVISSGDMAGIKTVMYQWRGTSMGANMNAMFQNDKMIMKAQFGLQ